MSDVLKDLPPEVLKHRVLLTKQAAALTGYSASQWRAKVRTGEAPPPIKLSPHRHGWKAGTLIAWLDAKAAEGKAA